MAENRPNRGTAKVPQPYPLPGGVSTLISLKKWYNVVNTYNKQNDEYLQFYQDGQHEQWTAFSVDRTRGLVINEVPAGDGVAAGDVITAQQARDRTAQLRRDLDTLLNNYASYVPESYYTMVIEDATSIQWIYDKLAESLGLESTKQYILNSHTIRYEPDNADTPEKLYMRLRSHYQQAAPRAGTNFNGNVLNVDATVNPLVELMLVEKTLERIDPRLPEHIVKTRGHLMEDGHQTLFCAKRLIFNQVETMLAEINMNENGAQINYTNAGKRNQKFTKGSKFNRFKRYPETKSVSFQDTSDRFGRRSSSKQESKDHFCGSCFRAGKPQSQFMDHRYEDCPNLSSYDKKKLFQAAIRMIGDNEECVSSESEEDDHQDSSTQ